MTAAQAQGDLVKISGFLGYFGSSPSFGAWVGNVNSAVADSDLSVNVFVCFTPKQFSLQSSRTIVVCWFGCLLMCVVLVVDLLIAMLLNSPARPC